MIKIKSSTDLGNIAKQARKSQNLTQDQLAAICGVGRRFIIDLEKGKPTCVIEKSIKVLQMLGLNLAITNK